VEDFVGQPYLTGFVEPQSLPSVFQYNKVRRTDSRSRTRTPYKDVKDSRPDSPFGGEACNIEIVNSTKAHMREFSFLQSIVIRGIENMVYELRDTFWLSRSDGSSEDALINGPSNMIYSHYEKPNSFFLLLRSQCLVYNDFCIVLIRDERYPLIPSYRWSSGKVETDKRGYSAQRSYSYKVVKKRHLPWPMLRCRGGWGMWDVWC